MTKLELEKARKIADRNAYYRKCMEANGGGNNKGGRK